MIAKPTKAEIDTQARAVPSVNIRELLRHPEVRNYQVAALASLVFLFGILFGRGSDIGAVLIVLIGVASLFLRWTAGPVFVIALTMYFLLFPSGLPELGYSDPWEIRRGHFRLDDVILAMATVVYVACQYRLFGILLQSIPSEGQAVRPGEAIRRPPGALAKNEIVPLFWVVLGVVVLGQLAWWLLTELRIDASEPLPLVWDRFRPRGEPREPGRFTAAGSRFVLLTGSIFALAAGAQVIFWYWRLRLLKPDEARMLLLDTAWNENRREHSRLQTWRAWVKQRAAKRERRRTRKHNEERS